MPPELEPGPFPLHALSSCQRSIVEDLTRLHRLPPEMPGLAALAVTGACVGKGAQLVGAVNGRAGNFANLFVFIGAPKSSGKGALGALADPLLAEDRRQREHHQRTQAPALNSELGNLQARVKFLRAKLAKGPSPSGQGKSIDLEVPEREILKGEKRIAQIQKDILEPALCVGDATSEALATQIVASPDESMLVYSPEAGDLLRVALGRGTVTTVRRIAISSSKDSRSSSTPASGSAGDGSTASHAFRSWASSSPSFCASSSPTRRPSSGA
jgi:hypothetical protein